MMPREDNELLPRESQHSEHRTIFNLLELLGAGCVDQIYVAAGDGAELVGIGAAP